MSYVDLKTPEALNNKALDLVKKVIDQKGRIKKGMNESTKAVERGVAKFLIISGDISPAETVMHLPKIAMEKKVPYMFVDSQKSLGKAVGIGVSCSSLALIEVPKGLSADLKAIISDISKLRK
jgi:large subunit ribosomal protein L7Ae